MFIGREKELDTLNRLYKSDKFEFAVIYGRRRVGKTALINKFLDGKKAVYFTGVESNAKQNLENLSKCIAEYTSGISADTVFSSVQSAFEFLFEAAEDKRIIFVIDEYPYFARAEKSLASTLQMLIDKHKDSSKLMLILCGSSMSYMEDNVLAYKSPLYGRRTAQLKIEPFDFENACHFFDNFSAEDKALIYGAFGGTPQYLSQINDRLSVEENIKNTFLNASSFLYEEPVNLLKQEVREPSLYTAIIGAVASGAVRMTEISVKIGENTSNSSSYIKNLISLGILKKESPYNEKESKRTIYAIEDNMFRFWYRFVINNSSLISRGAADLVYNRINPFFPDYMGKVFEDICTQYLWKLLLTEKSPVLFESLGRWWGNDPKEKCQTEIDIMGEQDKNTALFAECKWTNEKVDVKVLDTLVKRSELFSYKNTFLFLFAKTGFTQSCIDKAKEMGNVRLVAYEDMFN